MNEGNKEQRFLPDYAYEIEMLKRAGKRVCTMPYQGAWCNDCNQYIFCDIITGRAPYQVIEEEEIEMNEEKKHTIAVEMKTEGFEEAGEKIEVIADALDQMPATINLKAKDCEINIHNSIWIDRREENELEEERPGFKTTAIGGVIEETGKAEEEPEETPMEAVPRELFKQAVTRQILQNIKRECSEGRCESCIFKKQDEEGKPYCEIIGPRPADWKI